MPAYLHSLSCSQANEEISFVHPRTSVAGVISVPLLPVTFPCGSARCRKRARRLTLPQLSRLLALLANDRKALGPPPAVWKPKHAVSEHHPAI